MLGADWTQGHTTLGMVLTHSKGEGSYRLQAQTTDEAERSPTKGSGKVRSTLSGAFPYARHALDERLSVWGSAGYGSGTLTLTPEQATPIETDMDLMMGAVGVRGIALEATSEGRPQIAVTGDAMAVRTRSEAAKGAGGNLAETEADVTRLRVGVQSAWRGLSLAGGELARSLEIGVRHDGGDAETGLGLDAVATLGWRHAPSGLSAEISARGLLTHESSGMRDRGVSGALAWEPESGGAGLGPSLRIGHSIGASATGGMQALLSRTTLAGLETEGDGDELGQSTFDARFGYGLPAFGGRLTATPEIAMQRSDTTREYTLGWRLGSTAARRRSWTRTTVVTARKGEAAAGRSIPRPGRIG